MSTENKEIRPSVLPLRKAVNSHVREGKERTDPVRQAIPNSSQSLSTCAFNAALSMRNAL